MSDTYEDRIEHRLHEYREKRMQLGEARTRCREADNQKKRVIAIAMKIAEQRGHKTIAAQEREAYASESYGKWSDEDVAAFLERERLQAEIDVIELKWETWRTRRADRRAEMKLT
jgi:hypothetical protein